MIDTPQPRSRASTFPSSNRPVARPATDWSTLVASDGISPDAVRKFDNQAFIALVEQDCVPTTPAGCADIVHWCAMYDAKHVLAAFLDRWPVEVDSLDISPTMSMDKGKYFERNERFVGENQVEAVADSVLDKLLPRDGGSLKRLSLTDLIRLPDSGILATAVRRSATLESLSISTAMFPVDATPLLCSVFDAAASSRSLKSLSVSQGLADHAYLGASIGALFAHGRLESVKFSYANFPTAAAEAMAEAVASADCTIQSLSLAACFRGRGASDCAAIVLEGLKRNTSINTLDFSGNELDGEAVKMLCDLLKHNKSVTHLKLDGCKCGRDACEDLGRALEVNQTLVELDLSRNSLESAKALVEGLRGKPALKHLTLGWNGFSKAEGKHLANLVQDGTLDSLVLSHNPLESEGMDPIMLALASKCSLTRLELYDVDLLEISDNMIEGLHKNESLACLDLRSNEGMFGSRIGRLFDALDDKKIKLMISAYELKGDQIDQLAGALSRNSGVVSLSLDAGIDDGTRLICELARHIDGNYTIQELDVSLDAPDPGEGDAEVQIQARARAQAKIAHVTRRNAGIGPGIESCFEKFAEAADPRLPPELGRLILAQLGDDNAAAQAKSRMRMTVPASPDPSSGPVPSSGSASSTLGAQAPGR